MLPITNISTYKFAPLTDLKALRLELIDRCKKWKLKGTILLSEEGINLFVAGKRERIESLVEILRTVPGLEDLTPKISESDHQPFTRMLVKIKKEIIAFGVESVRPADYTSTKLKPTELKKWLDEGRDFLLLDTRNDYEIKLGTFNKAVSLGIEHFRHFPNAVRTLPPEKKDKPIVMFCTGGIRCEKAGPFMEQEGFKNIYQLDGGILKYFEECGGAHYEGGCFVFDQRVGVDPTLLETDDKQCFLCLSPLTPEDQKDPRYVLGKSCPYCFKTPEEKWTLVRREHETAIKRITTPLPGKDPYLNYRPLKIPGRYDGFTFVNFISEVFGHVPRVYWENEFELGHFLNREKVRVTSDQILKAGERYFHLTPATSEPDVNAEIQILYEDDALIVVNKPAPLPVHACGRFHRNTLQWILNEVFYPVIPRPAHRLDANTTGAIVFSRSKHFAGLLQPQFERGEVEKTYIARVKGHPPEDLFSCRLPVGEDELPAHTEFKVLKRHEDGTSLIEVNPKTGRTNQIRIHLWHLGYPIVGDQVHLSFGKKETRLTGDLTDPPLHLHSAKIKFRHPLTRQIVEFEAPNRFE